MDHSKKIIHVGDFVNWRGGWGTAPSMKAKVEAIELCQQKRSKYGKPVHMIDAALKDYCLFSLTNGHWAYGEQIDPLGGGS